MPTSSRSRRSRISCSTVACAVTILSTLPVQSALTLGERDQSPVLHPQLIASALLRPQCFPTGKPGGHGSFLLVIQAIETAAQRWSAIHTDQVDTKRLPLRIIVFRRADETHPLDRVEPRPQPPILALKPEPAPWGRRGGREVGGSRLAPQIGVEETVAGDRLIAH